MATLCKIFASKHPWADRGMEKMKRCPHSSPKESPTIDPHPHTRPDSPAQNPDNVTPLIGSIRQYGEGQMASCCLEWKTNIPGECRIWVQAKSNPMPTAERLASLIWTANLNIDWPSSLQCMFLGFGKAFNPQYTFKDTAVNEAVHTSISSNSFLPELNERFTLGTIA